MNEVIYLYKCQRCGKAHGEKSVEVTHVGNTERVLFEVRTCAECFEKTFNELNRVRPVFEAMKAAEVPDEIANDTMAYLLNKLGEDK